MEAICQVLPADIDPLHATDAGSRGRHLAPASRLATVRAFRDVRGAAAEVNRLTEHFFEQHGTLEPSRRADTYGDVPLRAGTPDHDGTMTPRAPPADDSSDDDNNDVHTAVTAPVCKRKRLVGLYDSESDDAPGTGRPAHQRPRRATGKRTNQRS